MLEMVVPDSRIIRNMNLPKENFVSFKQIYNKVYNALMDMDTDFTEKEGNYWNVLTIPIHETGLDQIKIGLSNFPYSIRIDRNGSIIPKDYLFEIIIRVFYINRKRKYSVLPKFNYMLMDKNFSRPLKNHESEYLLEFSTDVMFPSVRRNETVESLGLLMPINYQVYDFTKPDYNLNIDETVENIKSIINGIYKFELDKIRV